GHGPEVLASEPASRGAEHVRVATGPAEDAQAAPRARLDARARARVRHEPPARPGLGLQLPGRLGELPQGRPRPGADEEAAQDERRHHERAAGPGQQAGERQQGALGREGVQAQRAVRGDQGRSQLQDVVDRRGAPRAGAPRPNSEAPMTNPLAGHTNSYHTYSHDEALAGIAGAGFKHVELSAVPGWTEHVDLDADKGELRRKL